MTDPTTVTDPKGDVRTPGIPLAVDLDGTLLHTDTLHESLLVLARTRPGLLPRLPVWLAREGKAGFKRRVGEAVTLNTDTLPVNEKFLQWLREEHRDGRGLVLVTAADRGVATRIADRVGVFDDVVASDGVRNLAGGAKAELLVSRYGADGYDYAGNSRTDVEVWRHARRAVVVSSDRDVAGQAAQVATVERSFEAPRRTLGTWLRMVRSHQWLKNILVAVPAIAAHATPSVGLLLDLLIAFVSFSLCASAVYLLNDLVDLESDRLHARKRTRPFAAGTVPLWVGVSLSPIFLAMSVALSMVVGPALTGWVLVYVVVTTAYSFVLKHLVLIDCIVLALLYTVRVLAGGAATDVSVSFWLLALSVFLFLSLAFLKRYAELRIHHSRVQLDEGLRLDGRGYALGDTTLVQIYGVAAGYGAALVLALYLDSEAVTTQYATPQILWAAVPVLLYWISWLWLKANRGEMHDDPVIFAVKDRTSLAAGAVLALALVLANVVSL